MRPTLLQKLAAEAFGTFCLVFAGTGAIVINAATSGSVTHVGIALTFGLVVCAMIFAIGDISGCHINPAVTLGLVASRRFEAKLAAPYVAAQVAGAFLASLLMRVMFPDDASLGTTLPVGSPMRSAALEFVLTLILMFVILRVTTGAKEKGITAAIAIGGTIALDALFGGPISGASMNPARSLAPAIVSGKVEHLWVYLAAPTAGALAASILHRFIGGPDAAKDAA